MSRCLFVSKSLSQWILEDNGAPLPSNRHPNLELFDIFLVVSKTGTAQKTAFVLSSVGLRTLAVAPSFTRGPTPIPSSFVRPGDVGVVERPFPIAGTREVGRDLPRARVTVANRYRTTLTTLDSLAR